MEWRGSEAGRDSKALRMMEVEKVRKEWRGPDLERGEEAMAEKGHQSHSEGGTDLPQPIGGVGQERRGDIPKVGAAVPPAAPAQDPKHLPGQSETREGGQRWQGLGGNPAKKGESS